MTNTTCLQYCINSMSDRIFEFANTKDGKFLVESYKKLIFCREDQIEALLIDYNSFYMVQAAMKLKCLPETMPSLIAFMTSENFAQLHAELTYTVRSNYSLLVSRLGKKQRKKLEKMFD